MPGEVHLMRRQPAVPPAPAISRGDAVDALRCPPGETNALALFGVLHDSPPVVGRLELASVHAAADERLYLRGETGTAAYTVQAGLVRFERVTESGQRRIVRLAGRGDLIGQEALLQRPYADEAVACVPTVLCRLPGSVMERVARGEPALARALMERGQTALEQAEAWIADISSGPSRRRLLKLLERLLAHADDQGQVWLPRRQEIGDMLDVTLETASRLVSQLGREGVLPRVEPRRATVDVSRLAQALREADR